MHTNIALLPTASNVEEYKSQTIEIFSYLSRLPQDGRNVKVWPAASYLLYKNSL